MKSILFIAIPFLGNIAIASAQMVSSPYNNKPPKEYAENMADLYAKQLGLTADQKQQTYITLLEKRKTLDSLKTNNVHVDNDALWAINTSLDRKYKDILSARQYLAYEDIQTKRYGSFKLKMPDSTSSH